MRKSAVILAVVLTGLTAVGQVSLFDVGLGVRAMGFGGAFSAIAQGPEALLYNPGGLAQARGIAADSAFNSSLGLYSTWWLGGTIPNLGAGLGYLGTGVPGEPDLGFSQFALIAGYGLDLGPLLPIPTFAGLGLRFQTTTIAGEGTSGLAFDLGAITRFPSPFGELRASLVVRELGFGGWSTEFTLGGAWVSPFGLIAAVDLGSDYQALGVGWSFMGMTEVRAGLRLEAGYFRLAFGLGVQWGSYTLDYALLTHPVLATSHRFGFGLRF